MHILKILTVLILIVCMPAVLGCSGKDNDENAGTSRVAVSGDALKGDKIDASGDDNAGEPTPPSREQIIENPNKTGDDDDGIKLPDGDKKEPEKPIEGAITMDDLVYPVLSIKEGGKVKQKVGDVDNWGVLTSDPILEVWFYYSQILEGRNIQADNNFHEEGAGRYAQFIVKDGANTFIIDLTETETHSRTRINITRTR